MKTKLSTLFVSMAMLPAFAYQAGKTYNITILHTNDIHGRFWENKKGEYGLPAQKTLIDQIRKEVKAKGGDVLLLNAGDLNTGVPESDLQHAEPDIMGLNAIGYDAMVLGNHEFDFPQKELFDEIKQAKFKIISANVFDKKTHKTIVPPYATFKKKGLNILVYGLTTEDTAKLAHPKNTGDLIFKPVIPTAQAELPMLKKKLKADIVIALTHMGHYPDGKHGDLAPGDVSLARALPKGLLNLIIGGHSHTTTCVDEKGMHIADYKPLMACTPDMQNGTYIVQAEKWGKYVGRADFTFKDGKTTLVKYELIPVNLKKTVRNEDGSKTYENYGPEITKDPKLFAKLKVYQDKGEKLLNVKVGTLKGNLVHHRNGQTNFGNLVATVQREQAKADIGIVNSGGIRTSLDAGEITYRDILTAEPFNNTITTFDLTGKELIKYLTEVAMKEAGGYPQFSGVSMVVDKKAKKISKVKINGKPISMTKKYKVSIPDYLAVGGDGYPKMNNNPSYINTGYVDAQTLKEYFEKNKEVDASKFDPKNQVKFVN